MEGEISILVEDSNEMFLNKMIEVLKSNFPHAAIRSSLYSGLYKLILEKCYSIYILEYEEPSILKLVKIIRENNVSAKIILNTFHENIWTIQQILELNVSAVILKQNNLESLIMCIKSVHKGESYFCSRFDYLNPKKAILHKNDQLSNREMQVLKYVSQGKKTDEVAEILDISPHTVETHRRSIREKLNAETPSHVISLALVYGLLKVNELIPEMK